MLAKVLVLRALGALATFGVGIFLARILGSDDFGRYTFLIGSATFIATIGQFGSGMTLIQLRLGNPNINTNSQITGCYVWHIILSLVGIIFVGRLFGSWSSETASVPIAKILAISMVAFAILFTKNIYQSEKRSDMSTLPDMLVLPVLLSASIYILNITSSAEAIQAFVICGVVTCSVLVTFFFLRFKSFAFSLWPEIQWSTWTSASVGFFTAQLGHALIFMQLPVAFGFVATAADMGLYAAAYKLAATQLIAFTAVGTFALPQFADRSLVNDQARLNKFLFQTICVSTALAAPIFLAILVAPDFFMAAFYGGAYSDAGQILPILAGGIFFHTSSGPIGNFLLMNGEKTFYSIVSIAAGTAGVAAVTLFGKLYGLNGAAWATAITMILWKFAIGCRSLTLYRRLATNGKPSDER